MAKKIISLLERNNIDELRAYFDAMPKGKPLDLPDEILLMEHFSEPVVNSYIARFPLSPQAEVLFIRKAPGALRSLYINLHGLKKETQETIIKENLEDAAANFLAMRTFDDISFALDNASSKIIQKIISRTPLEKDDLVLKLLHHQNKSLFTSYVNAGRYISPDVLNAIIDERNDLAFKAFCYRQYRLFKKLARNAKAKNADLIEKLGAAYLPEDLQLKVLESYDWMFVEMLLKTTPLALPAQQLLFDRKFDTCWLKLHVTNIYATGGYRFAPELEAKLFKALAAKDLDGCLTEFRQLDDAVFVQNASEKAVLQYLEKFWLSDDAQVALMARGNATLISKLISRYSPEHGLCWQAEVKLCEMCSFELIRSYISFHTMCKEALEKLQQRNRETLEFYYSRHRY